MNSLRSRIAIGCSTLFVGTIAVISIFETLVLRDMLFSERQAVNSRIAHDIVESITQDGMPKSLDRWSSAMRFVQLEEQKSDGTLAPFEKSSKLIKDPELERSMMQPDARILKVDQAFVYNGRPLVVSVASGLTDIDATLARTEVAIILVTLFAIPLVILAAIGLSRSATRPIENLIFTMQQINSECLDQRAGFGTRGDELGNMARTFDAMLDRLRASFEHERRFIANASHELKTPLTVIHANAQMLLRWAQSDETIRSESIEAIISESKGLALLIEELILLARIDLGETVAQEPVALGELCCGLVRSTQLQAETRPIAVRMEAFGDSALLTVAGNATLLRRVVGNLLDNALKFTTEGEIVVVLTRLVDEVELVVSDTGPGIAQDELQRIFERLYRSDRSRSRQIEGFGLGLSIAREFVHIHHGSIIAERRPGGGTNVTVRLPVRGRNNAANLAA